MHKLARQVRFSINPFLPKGSEGFNSFVSKPAGEGLSIFFELSVEVVGEVEPATGFVVNVTDIDRNVREFAVPVFAERIGQNFRRAEHIGFFAIAELLKSCWSQLADKFGMAQLSRLSLKLNPFRKVGIGSKDLDMVYFSEKFEFAATHKLWNDDFSKQRNLEVFGKCANPAGHGHNYVVEVTIKMPVSRNGFCIGDFEKIVDDELIKVVDHKNLNADVGRFRKTNPTVENIAAFAWSKLMGKFGEAQLHCVTVWETDKTYCSYHG
ncbi:MAG: 6-pyruvoyl trahydropterin synthase family protein [Planctomycetota bacterium]|jgi:6-pyruvoyltetrahydropterin/6-carboxytetrahydropterin synthase